MDEQKQSVTVFALMGIRFAKSSHQCQLGKVKASAGSIWVTPCLTARYGSGRPSGFPTGGAGL